MEENLSSEFYQRLCGKRYMKRYKNLHLFESKNIFLLLGISNLIKNWKLSSMDGKSTILLSNFKGWASQ
jgi:hypothetical protein